MTSESRINSLAYADDVILTSTTKLGMEHLLRSTEEVAQQQGLSLNPFECVAQSIVHATNFRAYKVLTTPEYRLADRSSIHQLTPSNDWRYLGVDFRPIDVLVAH